MKNKLFFEMLGEDVTGLICVKDVLKKAFLDYVVCSENIYLSDGTVIPDRFANVISENRKILGIVGKNYNIIQNSDGFNFIDELISKGFRFIRAGSYNDYSGAFIILGGEKIQTPHNTFDIIILATNSFDGSGTIKLEFIPINIEEKSAILFLEKSVNNKITLKHCKQRGDILSEVDEILTAYTKYKKYFNKIIQALNDIHIVDVDKIIEEIVPINKNASNIIQARTRAIQEDIINLYKNTQNGCETAQKLIFSVANYESHRLPIRDTGNNQVYLDRILSGMPLTNEALKYIRRKFL